MFRKLKWRLIPIAASLIFLTYPLWNAVWDKYNVSNAAQATKTQIHSAPATKVVEGQPSRIIIPRFSIDLPIVPGSHDETQNKWSVSDTAANYAITTAAANNQQGKTLIYGHNNKAIFGPLLAGFKPGDKVYIHTANNHAFEYEFIDSSSKSPKDTEILREMKTGTGLNIITCEGANFEYRNVMSFKLVAAI